MASELRAVLLTGNALRHRYTARRMAANIRLGAVVSEAKAPAVAPEVVLSTDDAEVIRRHLAERDEVESRMLGRDTGFPDTECLHVPHGGVNDPHLCLRLEQLKPDVVMLYGTSIVRAPLLDRFADRIINIHLGLSPYYRGSGTNFWPLVHGQPECVGATIHVAASAVDAGGILAQVRPCVESNDRAHELGTRALVAALDALPLLLERFVEGGVTLRAQELSRGRVYRRRDFHANAVRQMWSNLDAGMLGDYLCDADARCAAYPIVTLADVVHDNQTRDA